MLVQAFIAQLAERNFCKVKVVGSNPAGGKFTECYIHLYIKWVYVMFIT